MNGINQTITMRVDIKDSFDSRICINVAVIIRFCLFFQCVRIRLVHLLVAFRYLIFGNPYNRCRKHAKNKHKDKNPFPKCNIVILFPYNETVHYDIQQTVQNLGYTIRSQQKQYDNSKRNRCNN